MPNQYTSIVTGPPKRMGGGVTSIDFNTETPNIEYKLNKKWNNKQVYTKLFVTDYKASGTKIVYPDLTGIDISSVRINYGRSYTKFGIVSICMVNHTNNAFNSQTATWYNKDTGGLQLWVGGPYTVVGYFWLEYCKTE